MVGVVAGYMNQGLASEMEECSHLSAGEDGLGENLRVLPSGLPPYRNSYNWPMMWKRVSISSVWIPEKLCTNFLGFQDWPDSAGTLFLEVGHS